MNGEFIKYIKGVEDVELYFSSINTKLRSGEEVLTFGARAGNPNSSEVVSFFLKTVENRSRQGIKTKIIFNDDARNIGKDFELLDLVDVRYMPLGIAPKMGFDIYGDATGMMDWSNPSNPRVILIEDKSITNSYREYFEILWSATIAISELEKKGDFWLPEILFEDFVNHSNEKLKVEQEILNMLKKQNPNTFLNIGSGFDTISKSTDFEKTQITLVEKNTSYVQAYKDKNIEVIHADFEFWNTEKKFDAILASHVLFYFDDKKEAICKVLNLLDNSGIALFVAHEPAQDYKKLKDFVFGLKGKKYTYTYDTLKTILDDSGANFDEVKVDCEINAKSVDELYKVLRLWFEMDLKTYYEHEKEIKKLLSDGKVKYSNSIFVVKK
jgi:SAM-dependent methyltransferase